MSNLANSSMRARHALRSEGITLIEMVMTIVILSIALLATVSVIAKSVTQSADPLIQHKSVLLAQAYFDEILTKRFAEQTPVGGVPAVIGVALCTVGSDGGEGRSSFDDVDDYDLLDEQPPQLQTGVNLADYADYRVQASVSCSGLALGLANDYDAKMVTVTITPPVIGATSFTSFRANY